MAIDYDSLAKVELTKGYYATIDKEDIPLVKNSSWITSLQKNGKPKCARARINGKEILMHRLIMNAKKGEIIDHINNDALDNRKSNLRYCNAKQNKVNSEGNGGEVQYKGVLKTKSGKYIASIKIGLGTYDTAEEAAKAYDKAARKYHKEFARPNFPTKKEEEKFKIVDHNKVEMIICRKKKLTGKYRGVHWHKKSKKWIATINPNYTKNHLGMFDKELDAAKAYDAKAGELLGDKAKLNFPNNK